MIFQLILFMHCLKSLPHVLPHECLLIQTNSPSTWLTMSPLLVGKLCPARAEKKNLWAQLISCWLSQQNDIGGCLLLSLEIALPPKQLNSLVTHSAIFLKLVTIGWKEILNVINGISLLRKTLWTLGSSYQIGVSWHCHLVPTIPEVTVKKELCWQPGSNTSTDAYFTTSFYSKSKTPTIKYPFSYCWTLPFYSAGSPVCWWCILN